MNASKATGPSGVTSELSEVCEKESGKRLWLKWPKLKEKKMPRS